MSFCPVWLSKAVRIASTNPDIPIPIYYVLNPDLSIEFTATFSGFTPEHNTKNT